MSSITPANTPCVSIILPCYNVELYLRNALDSALNQTLTNIEIIPVDDGSPDNCADIIREYAEIDSRVKPVFKQNGGYGTAVNAGLNIAKGEYIAIFEPDDYVSEDYYYVLYNEAKKDDLDVCGVNAYCEVRDFEPPRLIQTPWIDNPDFLSFADINSYFANSGAGITLKIYKNSFLKNNKIYLNESIRAYHDVPFIAEVLDKASKCRIIVGTGYFYRKDNPLSTTKNKVNFYNITNAISWIVSYAKDKRDSRKAALLGYSLKHLIFYYKRTIEASGENTSATQIYSLMGEILSNDKIKINSTNKAFIERYFPNSKSAIDYTSFSVLPFHKCPDLNLKYTSSVRTLSNLVAEMSFYTYYAITTKDINHIEKVRNNLYVLLANYKGIRGVFIDDFIKMYLSNGLFNYNAHFNQPWYLAFMNYMKEVDIRYYGRMLESITHLKSDKTVAQFMPSIAGLLDESYSDITDNLRKSKVIDNFSNAYMDKLLSYIKGKSIAVVGNAPSELGKGKGNEIDSHDIVIRFNNFSTAGEFVPDYGSKTNIWAITPSIESLFYQDNYYDFDYIVSPDINLMISESRISILYNYIILGGHFCYLNSMSCRRRFDMNTPSIGLYILSFLYDNLNLVKKVSLYGFSPLSAKKEIRHYYRDDPAKTSDLKFHDWDKEALIIEKFKKIFNEHDFGKK